MCIVVFVKQMNPPAAAPPRLADPVHPGIHNKRHQGEGWVWGAYQETNNSTVGSWMLANQRQVTFHLKTCTAPLNVYGHSCSVNASINTEHFYRYGTLMYSSLCIDTYTHAIHQNTRGLQLWLLIYTKSLTSDFKLTCS